MKPKMKSYRTKQTFCVVLRKLQLRRWISTLFFWSVMHFPIFENFALYMYNFSRKNKKKKRKYLILNSFCLNLSFYPHISNKNIFFIIIRRIRLAMPDNEHAFTQLCVYSHYRMLANISIDPSYNLK